MKKMIAMFLMVAASAALADDAFVPKDVEVPSALLDIVDWFAGNRVVQLGSLTSVVVSVVSLLKALAPVLGAKLSGKAAYTLTSVVALLGVIGAAASDGTMLTSGASRTASRNAPPVTTEARPVRAPSPTPAVDST